MLFGKTYKETMALINAIGAPVFLVDVEPGGHLEFLGANSLAEEHFEAINEKMRGHDVEDLTDLSDIHKYRNEGLLRSLHRCIELGSQIVDEGPLQRQDGTSRWTRSTFVPLFVNAGNDDIQKQLGSLVDHFIESNERTWNEASCDKTVAILVRIAAMALDRDAENQLAYCQRYELCLLRSAAEANKIIGRQLFDAMQENFQGPFQE